MDTGMSNKPSCVLRSLQKDADYFVVRLLKIFQAMKLTVMINTKGTSKVIDSTDTLEGVFVNKSRFESSTNKSSVALRISVVLVYLFSNGMS